MSHSDENESNWVSRTAALTAITIGSIVLGAWLLQGMALTPYLARMEPNAAVGLILAAVALLLIREHHVPKWGRFLGAAFSLAVLTLGILILVEDFGNLHFRIGDLLFSHGGSSTVVAGPGQTSPYAATNFVLLGTSLLCLYRGAVVASQRFTFLILGGSYLSLLGYLYGVTYLYQRYAATSVGMDTEICIIILAIGLLWAWPSRGLLESVTAPTLRGLLYRRLIPVGILSPLGLGWIRREGQAWASYSTDASFALVTTSTTFVFAISVYWVARDLARREVEHRRILSVLEEKEMRLRTLFDQIGDGIVVIDEDGTIESANPAMERLFGYGSELKGENISLLMPSPEREEHGQHLAAYMSTGIKKIIGIGREVRAQRKDGSSFPVDLSVSEFRLGNRRLFSGVMRNISDRQHALAMERHLAAIVDGSTDAIIGETLDGIITSWNHGAEELFGYPAEEAIGISILRLAPPDGAEQMREILDRVRRGERVAHYETQRIAKDGHSIVVSLTVSPLFNEASHVSGASTIARNITAQKKLEEVLHRSANVELIGQMAGGIAHDFNNLLTIINGYADLRLRDISSQDPMFSALSQIRGAGMRGAALTRQLLAFGRKQVLQPVPVYVNEIIAGMEGLLSRLIREDIHMTMALESSLPTVTADPYQIEQVVMNLVINASDAMPGGGSLIVETKAIWVDEGQIGPLAEINSGQYALISVRDTGTGMEARVQARLFEPFFTTKPVGKGTGLGLATVFGIVKQSGGYVNFDSEVGVGTTFRVYLPLTYEPPATRRRLLEIRSLRGTETILLIEDDDGLRGYAAETLRELGYVVHEAADGSEALVISEALRGKIDLAVTDVVMPNMGGLEAAEKLSRAIRQLRVLFMSGYIENSNVLKDHLGSAFRFLAKPFSPEDLGAAVRDALEAPVRQRVILVVHDDPVLIGSMRSILSDADYRVFVVLDRAAAVEFSSKRIVDLVIADVGPPDYTGLEAIECFRTSFPHLGFIALPRECSEGFLNAAELLGAPAVLRKPFSADELLLLVRSEMD